MNTNDQAAGLAGPVLHGMIVAGRFETFLERLEGYEIVELRVRFVESVGKDLRLLVALGLSEMFEACLQG